MTVAEDKRLEAKIVGRELKALIKFIKYLQKEKVDPNRVVARKIIRGSLISCYLQGKVDAYEKIKKER